MEKINLNKIEDLNYKLCVYILKHGIRNAVIRLSHKEILLSLSIYMTDIGFIWSFLDVPENGFLLTTKMSQSTDGYKDIIVSLDEKELASIRSNNSIVYVIKNEEKEKLKALLSNPINDVLLENSIHLKNEEIGRAFRYMFQIAEKEIDIISPWMNNNVVNDAFIELMENAIGRGVKLRILYGIGSGDDDYNRSRSNRSDKVAVKLQKHFAK